VDQTRLIERLYIDRVAGVEEASHGTFKGRLGEIPDGTDYSPRNPKMSSQFCFPAIAINKFASQPRPQAYPSYKIVSVLRWYKNTTLVMEI
jgi:hypothetical protein